MTPADQPGGDVTLGEIFRKQLDLSREIGELRAEVRDRHHRLSNEVAASVGPVSTLGIRMTNAETNLSRLDESVATVTTQANRIAGAVAVFAALVALVPWPWKR